ncbi:amidophosphoribosyltransferase [Helicobacter sp. 13S00401-1]|uniref:amidophosphoribosyltransferase n=1 Tax=Helicobacter sp. 13S00401-1 TaxID=1905758 RepID=UPI00209C2E30|nr:amidophosphoribosyltransferase [Helicobacter sp. 13S00401-1]
MRDNLNDMDTLKEKCAVTGIYNSNHAANLAYYTLFAMQHRGQEASGISVSNGHDIATFKDSGLVTEVFKKDTLKALTGFSAIGHNRYSTAGDNSLADSQPLFARYNLGEFSIAHNGNITNALELREMLTREGAIFQSQLDTEVILHLIARSKQDNLTARIMEAIKMLKGAFALVFISRSKMFALRDRFGLRPLSLAQLDNEDGTKGYVVASETCAFDLINAKFIRDVKPGELLIFERNKMEAIHEARFVSTMFDESTPSKPCIFEYVYFSRPDSLVFGRSVYEVRKALGRELAREHKIEADMVVPVPDSGIAAALGYSIESKIPFELGLIRNHYVGRTFIEPTQSLRELKVRLKLNPIKEIIKDKKVIVIDDSLVRGTTSKAIVRLLRNAGAKEVHLLIAAPQTISPCYYGVDTPNKEELICANKSLEEVKEYLHADSLGFLSLEGMEEALSGIKEAKPSECKSEFCKACFDGIYIE